MTTGKRPRINSNQPGRCLYAVIPRLPLMPMVLVEAGIKTQIERLCATGHRSLWTDSVYRNCPVWEKKA